MASELPALSKFKIARTGKLATVGDVAASVRLDPSWSVGVLLINALFFAMSLVLIVFALTRQVAGNLAALSAASLAAFAPAIVAYSRMLYYDLPMTTWFWISVGFIAWTARYKSVAGLYITIVLIAITLTTKQNGIFIVPLWTAVFVYVLIYTRANSINNHWAWHLLFVPVLGIVVTLFNYPTLMTCILSGNYTSSRHKVSTQPP